ncbi:hypothetical protein [Nodularia sp. NIES-3585]|uniref:hypothetical protein n=1 Tax=Nodularia sp. NIES-3585 TaxID=1973477 RepID=UPI000B5CB95A|nr:hypothetical protein [Nodularia sp. NIES-3585]GAX37662.1 hypothetical protein NIES3585_37070 [Nodularia sp. NIES-3585]
MNPKQLLEKAYQDITQLKAQLSSQKANNTKQASLINKLSNALDNLKKQYEDMLHSSDALIAEQINRIKTLEQEKRELLKKIEELEKNVA